MNGIDAYKEMAREHLRTEYKEVYESINELTESLNHDLQDANIRESKKMHPPRSRCLIMNPQKKRRSRICTNLVSMK